jgi:hypothetical protein
MFFSNTMCWGLKTDIGGFNASRTAYEPSINVDKNWSTSIRDKRPWNARLYYLGRRECEVRRITEFVLVRTFLNYINRGSILVGT